MVSFRGKMGTKMSVWVWNFRFRPRISKNIASRTQKYPKRRRIQTFWCLRGPRWTMRPARPAGPRPRARAGQPAPQGRCWGESWPVPKRSLEKFHENLLGGLLEDFHEKFRLAGQIQRNFMKIFSDYDNVLDVLHD